MTLGTVLRGHREMKQAWLQLSISISLHQSGNSDLHPQPSVCSVSAQLLSLSRRFLYSGRCFEAAFEKCVCLFPPLLSDFILISQ